jgi:hypothetical protein
VEAITDANKLHKYSEKMEKIIKLCLLVELGIPVTKIKELSKNL